MRRAIAAVFFAMTAALGVSHAAQAQVGFSYISKIQIGSDRAGTCYNVRPAGYPEYDFSRQLGACGGGSNPTPTPVPTTSASPSPGVSPSAAPTTVATTVASGSNLTLSGLSFINPNSCGTIAQPLPGNSDLTGCTAGYIVESASAQTVWTYSGYVGPPIVFVTPINDIGNVVGFSSAPTANGFSLQSVSLQSGTVNASDTPVLSYLILGNFAASGTVAAAPVTLQPSSTTVNAGQQTQLTAAQSGNTSFTAASNNADVSIAISGSTILVTGVSSGTSIVTVQGAGQQQAQSTVTVLAPVTLSSSSVSTGVGFTAPAIFASQAGNATFTAVSSAPNFATVSVSSGNAIYITGVAPGSGFITVTGANSQSAQINFNVPTPTQSSVSLNTYAITLTASGPSANAIASQNGNTTGYSAVSGDTSKVTVGVSGSTITVNPIAQTTTPINVVVTGTTGQPTATLVVTVLVQATSSTISLSPAFQSLQNGKTGTINVAYSGSDVLSVSSTQPSAVGATLSGLVVSLSALAPTTSPATITVTDQTTGVSGSATVSVNANPITFNLTGSAVSVVAGQTANFMAIQSGNTSFQTSSDSSNASVSNVNGSVAVLGNSPGIAHITVTGAGTSATVTATVTSAGVTLSTSSVSIVAGQQTSVTATQPGNSAFAYSASGGSPYVSATTSPQATNNVILSGLVPTNTGAPAAVTVQGQSGASGTLNVTVLPAQLVASGGTSVAAGSVATFNVSQVGNPGSYTVASSNQNYATASVQSQSSSGATIAVTGNAVGNVNITVQGQGGASTQVVVPFGVTVGPLSLSPNIGSLSLVAGTSSQSITISEPGWSTFSASVPFGVTSVSPIVSGSSLVIQGNLPATNVPVTITGETGSQSRTISVTVTAASTSSTNDASIVAAIQAAGATAVWPLNDAVSGATSFANGGGGAALSLSSGASSTATQAFPIVAGSSHSAFFNPLVGLATSAYVLGSGTGSAWTVVSTVLPTSLAGTKSYEIWSAGEPFSGHTGVALYLTNTGQIKLGYGITSSYNVVTSPSTIATSNGPATAFTQGHVIATEWTGTQFELIVDGGTPTVVTPSTAFASSATPLSFGNSTNTSAALAFLGYMQYPVYASTALSTSALTSIYNAETGSSSGTQAYPISFSPANVSFASSTAASQNVTAVQTNNTTSFSVQGYSVSGIVSATVASGSNTIVVTPQAAGSTTVTISGGGTTGSFTASVTATSTGSATLSISPSSASFAPNGPAQNFTILQTQPDGVTISSGFTIGTAPDSTCVTASISGATLTVTPKAITCSTSLTVNGVASTAIRAPSLQIKTGSH